MQPRLRDDFMNRSKQDPKLDNGDMQYCNLAKKLF